MTAFTDTSLPSCSCKTDPQLAEMLALMAEGYSQRDASYAVWGPDSPRQRAAARAQAGAHARLTVRRALTQRLPWLRLPTTTPVEVS